MSAQWTTSAWVDQFKQQIGFGLQVFPIDTPSQPAHALLAAGQLAETLGFDAFFVGDHPAWALEGWLHLAALAMRTSRIRLGSIVNCVSYRHPVMLARLAADLDQLSGGRLILGLGIGWDEHEFANLGLPFLPVPERQAQLEETIHMLRGVWGEEPFTFAGRYYQTEGARITPRPLQQPYPPLLLAGGGERVTLRQVAQYAQACNFIAFDGAGGVRTPQDVQHKLTVLRQHCDALQRPFDTVLCTHLTGWLILAPDEARLAQKLQHYFPQGIEQRFAGPWRDFVFAGLPAQAISYYQALAAAGVHYFVVELLDATDEETIHLLAEQVVPAVQDTFRTLHSQSDRPPNPNR